LKIVNRYVNRLLTRWNSKALASADASDLENPPNIFVSYAHEDEQAVRDLVAELEKRGIKRVWFAPKELQPGDQLGPEVKKAIDQARYFLLAATERSKNSAWVAKETDYALHRKEEGVSLRIIPLYLTSRDMPQNLHGYLAIDISEYSYKVGFEDLVAVLSGNPARGRTPLSKFEQFIDSLAIVDEEVQSAIEDVLMLHYLLKNNEYPQELETKLQQAKALLITEYRQKLEAKLQQTEAFLIQRKLLPLDRQCIMGTLNRGDIPPCLMEPEKADVRAWLRLGSPATLAIASRLYAVRRVWPCLNRGRAGRILKDGVVGQVDGWVNRGEIPPQQAPDPDGLIRRLIEEKLIRPFSAREYINEPDEKFQEFHEGAWLGSVGKAAYLFEINDPDRPGDNYPIGRFPGSTPREALR